MTIVSPGEQRRDFTYISDVVDANISAMNSDVKKIPFNIYNVGTGKNHSMWDITKMIGGETQLIDARPAEVKETLADIDKTVKDLKWTPKFNLEDMINSY